MTTHTHKRRLPFLSRFGRLAIQEGISGGVSAEQSFDLAPEVKVGLAMRIEIRRPLVRRDLLDGFEEERFGLSIGRVHSGTP